MNQRFPVSGGKCIGYGCPCFVIAEVGVNHNGDLQLALRLIDAATEAGADAVKFQTFRASQVAAPCARRAGYQRNGISDDSQADMLRALELDAEAHRELRRHCADLGVVFVSTPFDRESADLLDALDVPFIKIGSGDLTNFPLLEYVSRMGRPIVLSTGMANLAEVDEAVRAIEETGLRDLALLHCVSKYPANPADANLRAMALMERAWGYPVGYSDHTEGINVALAAVALGATVVEKHFTLDRTLPGPDHRASSEPDEFRMLVEGIREVEAALGHGRKVPATEERETSEAARRSLAAARDIDRGEVIGLEDIAVLRPGTGLPPKMLHVFVGRIARQRIERASLLELRMIE